MHLELDNSLVAEFMRPQKVYAFSSTGDYSIPKVQSLLTQLLRLSTMNLQEGNRSLDVVSESDSVVHERRCLVATDVPKP